MDLLEPDYTPSFVAPKKCCIGRVNELDGVLVGTSHRWLAYGMAQGYPNLRYMNEFKPLLTGKPGSTRRKPPHSGSDWYTRSIELTYSEEMVSGVHAGLEASASGVLGRHKRRMTSPCPQSIKLLT